MVGILVSFWDCLFSGAMLVSGSAGLKKKNIVICSDSAKLLMFHGVSPCHSLLVGTSWHNCEGIACLSLRILTYFNLCKPNKMFACFVHWINRDYYYFFLCGNFFK